jgi:hypothetical protein
MGDKFILFNDAGMPEEGADRERRRLLLKRFMDTITKAKTFTPRRLQKAMDAVVRARGLDDDGEQGSAFAKPSALSVQDMYDPSIFRAGESVLPSDQQPLNPSAMETLHVQACPYCRDGEQLRDDCYFSGMVRCIRNGWHPPIAPGPYIQKYKSGGNSANCKRFDKATEKEFDKMLQHGVLERLGNQCPEGGTLHPIGAVVKNSDKYKARVLTGIELRNQYDLDEANAELDKQGIPGIKVRMTTDCSQSGLNDASPAAPFRNTSIHDLIELITPECYVGKADITRYFFNFPLAQEARWAFVICWAGIFYCFLRCCFGYKLCPYYCCTWAAEIHLWMEAAGIPTSQFVDDWATVGDSYDRVKERLSDMDAIIRLAGFAFNPDKYDIGQAIVYLGILIDTVTMTLRMERTAMMAFHPQLAEYRKRIYGRRSISQSERRHVCGRLTWLGEVVLSGRLRTRSWWIFERYGEGIHEPVRRRLLEDTDWWLDNIEAWMNDEVSGLELPILSASQVEEDPSLIHVVQSDASGPDGFGYLCGAVNDDNPDYYSSIWRGDWVYEGSSLAGELRGLLHSIWVSPIHSRYVIWITDNMGAAFAVNRGRCADGPGLAVLSHVYHVCDAKLLQPVALWVPRELNQAADLLSHYAHVVNRGPQEGRASDLDPRNDESTGATSEPDGAEPTQGVSPPMGSLHALSEGERQSRDEGLGGSPHRVPGGSLRANKVYAVAAEDAIHDTNGEYTSRGSVDDGARRALHDSHHPTRSQGGSDASPAATASQIRDATANGQQAQLESS